MTSRATNTQSEQIGRINRRLVLSTILLNQPVARTEIAAQTGLTGASVSRITRDLLDAGVILEQQAAQQSKGPGRRFIALSINPKAGCLLSLSLNVFRQQVSLTDLQNGTIEEVELKFKDLSDPEQVIRRVVEVMASMVDKCRSKNQFLVGGAIAITGAIDPVHGVVRYAPLLHWRDVQLGARLEAELGVPFVVESLPNALNLAMTRFGIAKQFHNVMLMNCALGVGSSLYLDGRLLRSTDYMAGIAGSVMFPFAGSDEAPRSLDEVIGGWAVIAGVDHDKPRPQQRPADEMAARLLDIIEQAECADGVERKQIAKAGEILGRVMALYAGLVQPKAIILAGPLGRCRRYVDAARHTMNSLCTEDCEMPEILSSDMRYREVVRWLAIHEYLVNRDWELSS